MFLPLHTMSALTDWPATFMFAILHSWPPRLGIGGGWSSETSCAVMQCCTVMVLPDGILMPRAAIRARTWGGSCTAAMPTPLVLVVISHRPTLPCMASAGVAARRTAAVRTGTLNVVLARMVAPWGLRSCEFGMGAAGAQLRASSLRDGAFDQNAARMVPFEGGRHEIDPGFDVRSFRRRQRA